MNTSSYSEIEKIRFLAANFSRLQGLRVIPIGILLFGVSLWANLQSGPATNLTLPILLGLFCLVVSILIERYYRHTYGFARTANSIRKIDWIVSITGGIVALAAFVLETKVRLPVSLVGLVLAAVYLSEYIRMVRYSKNWYTTLTLFFALFIGFVSILPVLGLGGFWYQIGVRAQLLGVCMTVGCIQILSGIISHFFFVRALPKEVQNEQPI